MGVVSQLAVLVGEEKGTTMMGLLSNKIGRDELKPGDHIYSWRHSYLYAHHVNFNPVLESLLLGIYVGNGNVIHFTRRPGHSHPPCPRCGDQSRTKSVISSCLECFLTNGELHLFQYGVSPAIFLAKSRGGTCTLAPSDPPEDVLHRAEYLLHKGFGTYNLCKNNCEDFAIYCKTGLIILTTVVVGQSGQATTLLAAVSAIVASTLLFMTTGIAGLTAIGCGIYCVCRIVSDNGVRCDVMKIPVERLARFDEIEAETQTSSKEPSNVVSNLNECQVGSSPKCLFNHGKILCEN